MHQISQAENDIKLDNNTEELADLQRRERSIQESLRQLKAQEAAMEAQLSDALALIDRQQVESTFELMAEVATVTITLGEALSQYVLPLLEFILTSPWPPKICQVGVGQCCKDSIVHTLPGFHASHCLSDVPYPPGRGTVRS